MDTKERANKGLKAQIALCDVMLEVSDKYQRNDLIPLISDFKVTCEKALQEDDDRKKVPLILTVRMKRSAMMGVIEMIYNESISSLSLLPMIVLAECAGMDFGEIRNRIKFNEEIMSKSSQLVKTIKKELEINSPADLAELFKVNPN